MKIKFVKKILVVMLYIATISFSFGLLAAGGSNGGSGNGGSGGNGTGDGDNPSGGHSHTFVETVIEPTCTEKGYTLHKCECGEKYEDSYVSALDHKLGEWEVTTPATEEKDGEEKRICTRENCDYFETRKIPKLDHTHEYTETVIEPTCTEKGYTLHKCECGDEYKDNETEALGHLFGAWETITPATEDSEGLEQRVCARKNCGFKEERAIPVLSHTHHYITSKDKWYPIYWGADLYLGSRLRSHTGKLTRTNSIYLINKLFLIGKKIVYGGILCEDYLEVEKDLHRDY